MTLFREVGTFVSRDSFGASVRQEDRVRAIEVGYLVEKSGGVVTPGYVLISEDLELRITNERELTIFAFLGLGDLTQYDTK